MHTSKCPAPNAALVTALAPKRGTAQMPFASGAGVSCGLAMKANPSALVVSAPATVTVELQTNGETSIYLDFPAGVHRVYLESYVSNVLLTCSAAGRCWIEEVQAASLSPGYE